MAWRSDDDAFAAHLTVAERTARARRAASERARGGARLEPVRITTTGRALAASFWGKSWCSNLERYRDFAHRLERGRSYVRSGAVIDLRVSAGRVDALVSGSAVYEVGVTVAPLAPARWSALAAACAGSVASLIELLQGKLDAAVMAAVVAPDTGLFPAPREIGFACSCPDRASLCKHVAAALYGVGARLDAQPELLFVLRHVDANDLVAQASALGAARRRPGRRLARGADLAELFGIELAEGAPPVEVARAAASAKPRAAAAPATRAARPSAKTRRKA